MKINIWALIRMPGDAQSNSPDTLRCMIQKTQQGTPVIQLDLTDKNIHKWARKTKPRKHRHRAQVI